MVSRQWGQSFGLVPCDGRARVSGGACTVTPHIKRDFVTEVFGAAEGTPPTGSHTFYHFSSSLLTLGFGNVFNLYGNFPAA